MQSMYLQLVTAYLMWSGTAANLVHELAVHETYSCQRNALGRP
jgi:hypothetical protein